MIELHVPGSSFNWDFLIDRIAARRVIPVVGREVCQVEVDGRKLSVDRYLAERLADRFPAIRNSLSEDFDLNEVGMLLLQGLQAGRIAEMKSNLRGYLAEALADGQVALPEPLRALASITDFDLFVTIGVDDLLERALDEREAEESVPQRARSLAFFAHGELLDMTEVECNDLAERERTARRFELALESPLVYHPFGVVDDRRFLDRRRRRSIDFAITEEEVLERLLLLQTEQRRPKNLFDVLKKADLLFVGCGLPDGLARLLIRTLANERLRGHQKIYKIADTWATKDSCLNLFLRHCETEVVSLDPVEFAIELRDRWAAACPLSGPTVPEGKVFLSYRSEDRKQVLNFKKALEAAGLDVWFDQKDIGYGDDWRETIERGISACRLFIPFISQRSKRPEGVFREEWKLARDRAELSQFGADLPFLVPVILDDTPAGERGFPEEFWKRHVYRCPDGLPDQEFIDALVDMLQEVHLRWNQRQAV